MATAPQWVRRGLAVAVALVVFACFVPAVGNDFVTWDDPLNFTENVHYRGLSLSHLRWMFATFHMGHYQPLTWITFGLDYSLWGLDPTGYHLTNILLHTANAVLFYWISVRLLRLGLGSPNGPTAKSAALYAAAASSALLFAVHPLRVESVAWVSERRDVLSAFFYLATVLAYLRMQAAETARRRRWFALSLGCLVLSLLSKAWGMTLPLVLLALDVYPLRRDGAGGPPLRALILEKVPYMVPAGVAAALALLAQGHGAEMLSVQQYGPSARVAQAAYGLCFYLWKTLVPTRLSPVYPLAVQLDPTEVRYLLCGVAVLSITALAIATWKRWPWLLVGWFCYAVIVSPVLGLLQTGPQIAADRYTYLSCLPWALLAAAALYHVSRGGRKRKWLVTSAALGGLGVLGMLTIRQTRLWRDSTILWNHALRLDPNNAIAYVNRGAAYESKGDLDRALADYVAAIQRNGSYADAYFGRGNVRRVRGDLEGALADYNTVVQLRAYDPNGYANRGGIRHVRGELEAAAADYHRALELAPADWAFRDVVLENLAQIRDQHADSPGAR
jgi:hypothetical protein